MSPKDQSTVFIILEQGARYRWRVVGGAHHEESFECLHDVDGLSAHVQLGVETTSGHRRVSEPPTRDLYRCAPLTPGLRIVTFNKLSIDHTNMFSVRLNSMNQGSSQLPSQEIAQEFLL